MLRITRIDGDTGVCLKVEGRLTGEWVTLLESELEKAARDTRALTLDLGSVDFASMQGADLLMAARARGVRLNACSPYVSDLLATRTA